MPTQAGVEDPGLAQAIQRGLGEATARRSLRAIFRSLIDADPAAGNASEHSAPKALQQGLRSKLVEAVAEGELPETADVGALSCLAFSLSVGFLQYARAGMGSEEIIRAADFAVDCMGFHREPDRTPGKRPLRKGR